MIRDLTVTRLSRKWAQVTVPKAGPIREIHAQAWSMLRTRLEHKASAATSTCVVVAVNPANTSQRCHTCGHTAKENRENQAAFACVACKHTANADVNAARNILAAGLAVNGRGGNPDRGPDEASTTPTKREGIPVLQGREEVKLR